MNRECPVCHHQAPFDSPYCPACGAPMQKASEEGRVFWVTRAEFAEMKVIWGMKDVLCVCDEADLSEMFWDEEKSGWVLL